MVQVRTSHGVPTAITRFECADALAFRLPRGTALVYVDDTSWDEPTVRQLAAKLSRQLPPGAVVVHNSEAGYSDSPRYSHIASYEVGTSWNPRHSVNVHTVA